MKSSRTTLVATAIPLLLTSLPLAAGELPFNAPATVRAKESAPLLHQTARALYDLPSSAALPTSNDKHITNLWLFPTADGETVFARYNLTSGDEPTSGAAASATQHLTMLTVRENRIVESRELTSAPVGSASNEPKPDWSAAIGSGYTARGTARTPKLTISDENNADTSHSSPGVLPSPHWTAAIGTGTAAARTSNVPDAQQNSSSETRPVLATADWTSRIGTGHAVNSPKRTMYASLANAR